MSYQNGGQFQQWLLEYNENGRTYIKNRATGRYLSGGGWVDDEVDTDRTNNGNHWLLIKVNYYLFHFRIIKFRYFVILLHKAMVLDSITVLSQNIDEDGPVMELRFGFQQIKIQKQLLFTNIIMIKAKLMGLQIYA